MDISRRNAIKTIGCEIAALVVPVGARATADRIVNKRQAEGYVKGRSESELASFVAIAHKAKDEGGAAVAVSFQDFEVLEGLLSPMYRFVNPRIAAENLMILGLPFIPHRAVGVGRYYIYHKGGKK